MRRVVRLLLVKKNYHSEDITGAFAVLALANRPGAATRIQQNIKAPHRFLSHVLLCGIAVLLISAGIGATPVLAMLHALVADRSEREIWWLHGARNSGDHSFAAETRSLIKPARPASSEQIAAA